MPNLTQFIGQEVTVDFCGRTATGVVDDVDHGLSPLGATPELRITTQGATLRVSPEDVLKPE